MQPTSIIFSVILVVTLAAYLALLQRTGTMATRAPVICISHGGGPMPVLGDPGHRDIIYSLKHRVPRLLKLGTPDAPRAVVVVTAHWSKSVPTISSGRNHSLYYDYGGFPPESYSLQYPAPGSPELADEVRALLSAEGFEPALDEKRGWDHGVFIPFLLINPAADIPIVQMSVLRSEDPAEHVRMGAALSRLRDANIALVGSGFASFHNLSIMSRLFSAGPLRSANFKKTSDEWNAALSEAVAEEKGSARAARLQKWRDLPHSYEMHPPGGGEHFMPLLVCSGAAGDEKVKLYRDRFLGIDIWTYYWDTLIV